MLARTAPVPRRRRRQVYELAQSSVDLQLSRLLPGVPTDDNAASLRPYVFAAYACFFKAFRADLRFFYLKHNAELRLDLHSELDFFLDFFSNFSCFV